MKILILNQSFYPDVVSTAQHASDLALVLAEKGHEVSVISSRTGYDNPEARFPKAEVWKRVQIRRIHCLGLGKAARWRRALDFGSFLLACSVRLLLTPPQSVVVAMTSPPLISWLAALFVRVKGGSLVLWMMDLNPDQAVAAGWLREGSTAFRFLHAALLFGLRQANSIIVLDRFMRARIEAKGIDPDKICVVPPWSHDEHLRDDRLGRDEFRRQHGLSDKFVVMYSGNHSPCHPLDTLLGAARELSADPEYAFCFIGGGSEHRKVREFAARHNLANVVCLPYQPLDSISHSLSAADLHVVVLGNPFVGIVHPCKVYNILALGIPFLYIGPERSHILDIVAPNAANNWSFVARHGDVSGVVRQIRLARGTSVRSADAELGLARQFSRERLVPQTVAIAEAAAATSPGTQPDFVTPEAQRAAGES